MELWAHQKAAVEKASVVPNLALFMEMGTGKTATTVHILRKLINAHRRYMRTLIVCPKSVMPNWKREILTFSKIEQSKIYVLDGTLDHRAKVYTESAKDSIFVVNFESFAFEKFAKVAESLPPEVLILDESHRVKDSTSKRTKALIKVSKAMEKQPIKHRYILTGTPVLNNELDLFSQFLIMDGGKTLGTNFFAYRATYFTDKNMYMPKQVHFPKWVVKPEATEKLKQLIAPVSVTAKKDECLDLPPLVKVVQEVVLSKEQKKAYDSMEADFIAFIGDNPDPAIATLAITKVLRMQQILSGFLVTVDGEVNAFKENPRAEALEDLLSDYAQTEKVIVWSIFKHDYEVIRKICNKLKLKYAEVTGETSDKQAELNKFEKDSECRVMIASPQAGGTGVNMTEASLSIYYSRSYSLEHDLQSESRNYRGGSEKHKKVTRIDLVAKNTVDEAILEALRNKFNLASNITQLKKYMR